MDRELIDTNLQLKRSLRNLYVNDINSLKYSKELQKKQEIDYERQQNELLLRKNEQEKINILNNERRKREEFFKDYHSMLSLSNENKNLQKQHLHYLKPNEIYSEQIAYDKGYIEINGNKNTNKLLNDNKRSESKSNLLASHNYSVYNSINKDNSFNTYQNQIKDLIENKNNIDYHNHSQASPANLGKTYQRGYLIASPYKNGNINKIYSIHNINTSEKGFEYNNFYTDNSGGEKQINSKKKTYNSNILYNDNINTLQELKIEKLQKQLNLKNSLDFQLKQKRYLLDNDSNYDKSIGISLDPSIFFI